ncbi:MAG: disulfide bond formation protein DsbB [Alteromonadaceae bacterium]|nr:disulfide bond formation protein DsbB [Alteromonadaceae bacterium]
MELFHGLSSWAEQKSAWLVLFVTSLALEITALYFQHGMGLEPCIMCIYQRTAMWGIVLAGAFVLLANHPLTRLVGYGLWGYSAVRGFLIASEHIEIIESDDPFFGTCEIFPNFPEWAPLHEWLPAVFAAKGDCLENSWQFMSMGMAEWMQIIFGVYFATLVLVLLSRIIDKKLF